MKHIAFAVVASSAIAAFAYLYSQKMAIDHRQQLLSNEVAKVIVRAASEDSPSEAGQYI